MTKKTVVIEGRDRQIFVNGERIGSDLAWGNSLDSPDMKMHTSKLLLQEFYKPQEITLDLQRQACRMIIFALPYPSFSLSQDIKTYLNQCKNLLV